jgi:hypothetical protein
MRAWCAILVGALVLVTVPAHAQVQIETRPPAIPPAAEIVTPRLHYQVTRPSETDYYPQGPRVEHDPAFIEPFAVDYATPTSTGTIGLSGWTSPAIPVGHTVAGYHEVTGWLAVGLSITWGGPPPARRAAPAR